MWYICVESTNCATVLALGYKLRPTLFGTCASAVLKDYDYVKDAIFHRYELNVETFRQRFRAYRYSNFDGPREAYPERKTGEQILEMIALEQFIEILPDKVKLWVQEHRPETSTKAISLAEDFLLKLFPFSSDLFKGQGKPGKTKREKRLLKAQWKTEHSEPKKDFPATANW
uniref:SCAN box domain-containing protein n=1 Tax=Xenopus tropicalis TaxID=8364 RepID=A0A803JM63_XENTR